MVALGIVLGTDVATVVYAQRAGMLGVMLIPLGVVTLATLVYAVRALWGKPPPPSDAEQS